jgi:hypothetical protein
MAQHSRSVSSGARSSVAVGQLVRGGVSKGRTRAFVGFGGERVAVGVVGAVAVGVVAVGVVERVVGAMAVGVVGAIAVAVGVVAVGVVERVALDIRDVAGLRLLRVGEYAVRRPSKAFPLPAPRRMH